MPIDSFDTAAYYIVIYDILGCIFIFIPVQIPCSIYYLKQLKCQTCHFYTLSRYDDLFRLNRMYNPHVQASTNSTPIYVKYEGNYYLFTYFSFILCTDDDNTKLHSIISITLWLLFVLSVSFIESSSDSKTEILSVDDRQLSVVGRRSLVDARQS
jgi:hypothetical protein